MKNDNKRPQVGGNSNFNRTMNQGNDQSQTSNCNKKIGKPNRNQSDNRSIQQKTDNENPPPTCENCKKITFANVVEER